MIGLARRPTLARFMHRNASTSALARRFVGGRDIADVLEAAKRLRRDGFRSSLFYLGEYVADPDLVATTVARKIAVAAALGSAGLDVHVSVDPTQVGYSIDDETGRRNMLRIGRAIAAAPRNGRDCLMLDMEDYGLVERTLALRDELARDGVPVAQTLQAYLRRTEDDLNRMIAPNGAVRLVKGAFAESRERAFQTRAEIDRNYLNLAARMLSDAAKTADFYPIFGTHDERMIRPIAALARERGWTATQYEFEMLYGVRPNLQRELRDAGAMVRLYVPFGDAWWPYAVRRVGESPRNVLFVVRAIIGG